MPDVVCPNCGTVNHRKPSKADRVYCNKDCFNNYLRSRHFGEQYGQYTIVDSAPGRNMYLAECVCGTTKAVRLDSLKNGDTKSCGCHTRSKHIGERYGWYTIIDPVVGKDRYLVKCDCGIIKAVPLGKLTRGEIVSCGCYNRSEKKPIEPGTKFGRLTVLERAGTLYARKFTAYSCQCSCGNKIVAAAIHLRSGNTTSCGCYHREISSKTLTRFATKHGLCKYPAYVRYLHRARHRGGKGWTLAMDQALHALQPVCVICGSDDRLAIDHVIPFIKGGKLKPGNVCVLCIRCNSAKRDKTLEELPPEWQTKIRKAAQEFYDIYE